LRNRNLSTIRLATVLAGFALGGCYGTPPAERHPDGAAGTGVSGSGGGSGGSAGGNPADASDATSDSAPTGCPSICPGPTTGTTTGSGACVSGECRISCNPTYPTLCAASNACVDLTSDGKNCGTCGHDCLGGTCTAGQCQPVLIARYLGYPQIIVVGTDAVYVTTDLGYVGRAKKDGSDLKPFAMPGFASSAFNSTFLAEDGDRVFLSRLTGSTVQLSYCSISGCDATAVAFGGPYSLYFAVDGSSHKVFWLDYSPTQIRVASSLGTVSGSPISGGALASGASISRVVYAQGGIYFADAGSVQKLPASGGTLTTVAASTSMLSILGTNSSSLYVFDGSVIGYVPLPNGTGRPPTPVVMTTVAPHIDGQFAADDAALYWVTSDRLQTCDIVNCPATVLTLPSVTGDHVYDVGIDDKAIYWVESTYDSANGSGASTAWKLAK